MPDPSPDSPPSQVTPALADHAIVSGGDNAGKINPGLIIKIHRDDIEMEGHATMLIAAVGDVMGRQQAQALGAKLLEAHWVEGFGQQFMQLPPAERGAKFGDLDEAGADAQRLRRWASGMS